jgi:hypothetical protein
VCGTASATYAHTKKHPAPLAPQIFVPLFLVCLERVIIRCAAAGVWLISAVARKTYIDSKFVVLCKTVTFVVYFKRQTCRLKYGLILLHL